MTTRAALDHLTRRLASRRLLLVSGAVAVALATVLFATSGPASLAAVADRCGQPAPDVRFTTSAEGVATFLAGCGHAGRAAYRDLQLLDLVYPAAIGTFLAAALALLLPRVLPAASDRVRLVVLVPLLGALADYTENLAAWALLARYPEPATWAAHLLGIASAAKQTLNWASFTLVALALAAALIAWVRARRFAATPTA